jgi:hypothetical protein
MGIGHGVAIGWIGVVLAYAAPVVRPRRQSQPVGRLVTRRRAEASGRVAPDVASSQRAVDPDTDAAREVAFRLTLAGGGDPRPTCAVVAFAAGAERQGRERHRRQIGAEIDAIRSGPDNRDALLHSLRRSGTRRGWPAKPRDTGSSRRPAGSGQGSARSAPPGIDTAPSSSGWRRTSSAPRELRHLVEEQDAVVRERDLARARLRSPPTSAASEIVWCGARNGRLRIGAVPGASRPATEWIAVTSIAASTSSSGSRPGSRRASIILLHPGGPDSSR